MSSRENGGPKWTKVATWDSGYKMLRLDVVKDVNVPGPNRLGVDVVAADAVPVLRSRDSAVAVVGRSGPARA